MRLYDVCFVGGGRFGELLNLNRLHKNSNCNLELIQIIL
jgi:hypothetical protein